MKEDISILIVNKITMLIAILGGIIGVIKVVNDLAKTKADKDVQIAKENSAGQVAIAEIRANMEIMKKLVDENKITIEQVKHFLDKIEQNYSQLLERFMDFLKK